MDAVLYTTNTGSTERYAVMFGEKTGLPVYPLGQTDLPEGAEIIYMGWVMASGVKGYKKAAKKYKIKAVCGICMAQSGSQLDELRKANGISDEVPVFTLQGGFDINKLRGIYKFMMLVMKKTVGKSMTKKPDRTPEENDMLDMMLHGGDRVDEKNMDELLNWFSKQ